MSDENVEITEEAKEPEETEPKQDVQEIEVETNEAKPVAEEKNEVQSTKPEKGEMNPEAVLEKLKENQEVEIEAATKEIQNLKLEGNNDFQIIGDPAETIFKRIITKSECPEWYVAMSAEQKVSADNIMKEFSNFSRSELLNELKNKLNRDDEDCKNFMHWWLDQNQEDTIMEEEGKREPSKKVAIVRPIQTGRDVIEPIAPPRFPTALTPGTYHNTLESIPKTLGQCVPSRAKHEIDQGGDCLYEAIAHEYAGDLDPESFRGLVWDHILYLKENGSEDQKKIIEGQEQKYGGEKEFEELIKIPGKWESDLAEFLPNIIAHILAFDIHVYDENHNLMPDKSVVNGNDVAIRLIYNGENQHFDATTPSLLTNSPLPMLDNIIDLDAIEGKPKAKRFTTGTRVCCKIGLYTWEKGTITEDSPSLNFVMGEGVVLEHPLENCVYEVVLDNGNPVTVPRDEDMFCRALDEFDDNPILHQVPEVPKWKGKEFQGKYTSGLGTIEFKGHKVIVPEQTMRRDGSMMQNLRRQLVQQRVQRRQAFGIETTFRIEQGHFCLEYGGKIYLLEIEDDGDTLCATNMGAMSVFGHKLYKLPTEDQRPFVQGKSLEGTWYAGGSSLDCMVKIRGFYVVWGEEYLAKRRRNFQMVGSSLQPNEKNIFTVRGSQMIFIDDDGTTTCLAMISNEGNTLTFSESSGFGVWQKCGEYEPVTVSADDFPLGLYECTVSTNGIERGARHYVTQVRVDMYKIFGKLDDAKQTWALLSNENDIYFTQVPEDFISSDLIDAFFEMSPDIKSVQLLFRIVKNCKTKRNPIKVSKISTRFGDFWDFALNILGAIGFDMNEDADGNISFDTLNNHEVDYVLRRLKDKHTELKQAQGKKSENKDKAEQNKSEKKKKFEGEN